MAGLFASFKNAGIAAANTAAVTVNTIGDAAYMAQDGVQFARRALQNALAEQAVEQKINATSFVERALAEAQTTLAEDMAELSRRLQAKPEVKASAEALNQNVKYQERLAKLQTELDKHVQTVFANFEEK